MKKSLVLAACAPIFLAACSSEPPLTCSTEQVKKLAEDAFKDLLIQNAAKEAKTRINALSNMPATTENEKLAVEYMRNVKFDWQTLMPGATLEIENIRTVPNPDGKSNESIVTCEADVKTNLGDFKTLSKAVYEKLKANGASQRMLSDTAMGISMVTMAGSPEAMADRSEIGVLKYTAQQTDDKKRISLSLKTSASLAFREYVNTMAELGTSVVYSDISVIGERGKLGPAPVVVPVAQVTPAPVVQPAPVMPAPEPEKSQQQADSPSNAPTSNNGSTASQNN